MRYIDADALKKRLEDFSKWCKDGRKEGVDFVLDCPLPDIPTADVVPKSEVEELKAIIADHKANEERWQELYADTVDKWEKAYEELEIKLETVKAEVAREIIAEIDAKLHDMATEYHNAGHPEYFAVCEMVYHKVIRAVEKKYTEEPE